jgi:phage protein D
MTLRSPFYQVMMEGQDITSWISAVTVVEDDRQADNVSLIIQDPRMIYADCLFEGSTVEVDLGYTQAHQHALMIRAIITKVELSYPDSGVPALTLKGEDRSILMGLVEHNKVWRDQTVTDIVRKINDAQPQESKFKRVEAQLNPDPMIKSKPIHQDGKTDLAFLQDLAQKYHAKCFVELDEQNNEVLYFIPERRIMKINRPDENIVLYYRTGTNSNLLSFTPSFDSSYIDRLKDVSDLDHHGKKIESQDKPPVQTVIWSLDDIRMAQASKQDRPKLQTLYDIGSQRKEALQEKLEARQPVVGEVVPDQSEIESTNDTLESLRLGMTASGTTFGNIWLRAKSKISIQGVNQRFAGAWYVSTVTHKVDGSGYRTDFKCVR